MTEFLDLPTELQVHICVLGLKEPKQVLSLCRTNRTLYNAIWNDDEFWRQMLISHFSTADPQSKESCRKSFIRLSTGFRFGHRKLLAKFGISSQIPFVCQGIVVDKQSDYRQCRMTDSRTWTNCLLFPRIDAAVGVRSVTVRFNCGSSQQYVNLGLCVSMPPGGNAPGFLPDTWGLMAKGSGYPHLYHQSQEVGSGSRGFEVDVPLTMRLDCGTGDLSAHQLGECLGRAVVPTSLIRERGLFFVVCMSYQDDVVEILKPDTAE
jgi:hypothetical protein